ncbi:GNAT family N-acetyltransferase [Microbacterium sp. H1-D42]|uniref:GNAT family N-acetyltransferase n=1 Tax=Microbacterium sp. H1-D42 TaxID=2925844 RepID=UPI001F533031|nr:GNAT family N-acetyltransferase [Microbacterium sp. H1-D42]UNK71377.1 GNAT family N-acetyltransferase [Microbacterium sp. H1-D42]
MTNDRMPANRMLVRNATVADAHDLAVVHVRGWQEAYRGLMPQDVLDGLSIPEREANWARFMEDPERSSRTLVVERDGHVVGWAGFGSARDDDAPGTGELWGIYAHPDTWATGVGHALLTAVEAALRAEGHEVAYLWVLEGNDRAAGFYERHDWRADGGTKIDRRPGLVLHEHRHVKRLV